MQITKPPYRLILFVLALAAASACERERQETTGKFLRNGELSLPGEGGAVSVAPVEAEPAAALPSLPEQQPVEWSPLQLSRGEASVSCELDYREHADGDLLADLSQPGLQAVLAPCSVRGVTRVRYKGRIDSDFTRLIQRITTVADELGIDHRVLDLHSTGGLIEDAIRAGDFIGESNWSIWVREDSYCHSACVLILSAGDKRTIAGQVGIHRIIRMSSTARTRAELNQELHVVHRRVREYLERNGAALAVADLMMAVPNRSLRLLSGEELQLYGLDGLNPAQDDLDRLQLMRECGEDFVGRRDAFERAFERRCRTADGELEEINKCGLALRQQFGFPDATCPAASPYSEFDTASATSSS
jgi:membrane-bound ClpP family serine protease